MQIFVYEFITGGGAYSFPEQEVPGGSLLREGSAMCRAVSEDFARLRGASVSLLLDRRLPALDLPANCHIHRVSSPDQERQRFASLAAEADATVVIAPEFDQLLLERCRWSNQVGARLLSPGCEFVAMASDKQRSANWLQAAGVPVPRGGIWRSGQWQADIEGDPLPDFPLVRKPVDGAGSTDVRLITNRAQWELFLTVDRTWRLESYHTGRAASLAVLCGPQAVQPLPACRQLLSDDGEFRYLGGQWPLSTDLAVRAERLAHRALPALRAVIGYVGLDLVLGDQADGSGDVVIEINPRLTTSYVGLRRACRGNLAEAMLAVARGTPTDLHWRRETVTWDA